MKRYNFEPTTRFIAGREIPCLVLGEGGRGRRETIVLLDSPLGEFVEPLLPKPGNPGRPKVVNSPEPKKAG